MKKVGVAENAFYFLNRVGFSINRYIRYFQINELTRNVMNFTWLNSPFTGNDSFSPFKKREDYLERRLKNGHLIPALPIKG
jgi:hypothetical protein